MSSSKPHQDIGNHFEPIDPQECYDILMNVPVSILRSTPDGRLLSTNHTAAHKLGYKSPQELVESITDIASQIYADPGARKEILHLLEAEGIVEGHECRQLRKDGSEFWASNTMRAVRSQEGDITHYQVLILDITQRKQAEKAQQESERRFRALAEKFLRGGDDAALRRPVFSLWDYGLRPGWVEVGKRCPGTPGRR